MSVLRLVEVRMQYIWDFPTDDCERNMSEQKSRMCQGLILC